jgi:flagellar biosynthesis GTPase FlhF
MRVVISSFRGLVTVAWVLGSASLWAQDPYGACPRTFNDRSFGSADFRESCASVLREDRAQLEAWGVATQGMSDLQVWDRYGAEVSTREQARQDQERRDALERERIEAQRAASQAESQRIQAERERQANESAAQQMQSAQQMIQQQNEMMRGLGVNLGGLTVPSGDSDEDDSAFELKMYQDMIDNGVAPQCKGKDGDELIACVDAALDVEDDKEQ